MQSGFNIEKADGHHKPLEWIKQNLVYLPESGQFAGEKIGKYILPFQEKIIKTALTKEGKPSKNIFMGFSRKIAKSSITSWILCYILTHWEGARGVVMGSTFGQAEPIFSSVTRQFMFSDVLSQYKVKTRLNYMEIPALQTRLQKIFSRADSNLGMIGINFMCVDELSAHESRENLDNIQSGMIMAKTKPLCFYLSNPSKDPSHFSVDFFKNLKQDPHVAYFDFSAPASAKVSDRRSWERANPFYKHWRETKDPLYKPISNFLEAELLKAQKSREEELKFMRFYQGKHISVEAQKFCDVSMLKTCNEDIFQDKNLRWCMGVDLSWHWDFTSFCIVGHDQTTDSYYLKDLSFLATLKNRFPAQKTQFQAWAGSGLYTLYNQAELPRNRVINHVKDYIDSRKIKIEKVISDLALSKSWRLSEAWPDFEGMWMTPRKMASPLRVAQKVIMAEKFFVIGPSALVKWHFNCAMLSEKSQGYCTAFKSSKHMSIDILDATTLAIKFLSETKKKKHLSFIA